MPEEPLTQNPTPEEELESKFISAEALPEEKAVTREKAEGGTVIRTMQKDIEALQARTAEAVAAKVKAEEEARKAAEEEARKIARAGLVTEEEKKRAEEEAARLAAEETRRAEEEARIKAEQEEIARKAAEAEEMARIQAEEAARLAAEEEARIKAEAEEAARKAVEAEAITMTEAEKMARAVAEEEAKRAAEEARRAEEEARIKMEEEQRRAAEEEAARLAAEETKKKEFLRLEEEAKARAEAAAAAEKAAMEEAILKKAPVPGLEKPPTEEIVITRVGELPFYQTKSFRLILSGLAIILIAIAGLTFYWQRYYEQIPLIPEVLRNLFLPKPPVPPEEKVEEVAPPPPPPPIERPVEVPPSLLLIREPEKTVTITPATKSKTDILEALTIEIQTQEPSDTLKRIILKVGDHYLTAQEFFEALEISTPPGWLANFAGEFNFFIYTQKEGYRWAMVLKWRDAQKALNDLQNWETTGLDKDLDPLYIGIVKGLPVVKEFLSDTTSYRNIDVRYMNFPFEDLSVDYAFYKDYLLLSSSRKSMYKLVDLLVLEEEL